MGDSKYDSVIQDLAKRAIFTAAEARAAGVPSRMLAYYCNKGVIERISRGVYRGMESSLDIQFEWEDLAQVALSIPNGVICLISALCYYGLTDQVMRAFWIAVPHTSKSPRRPKARIIRMRNMTLGQTQIKLGSCSLRIFDRERTVVDAFRHLSEEVAVKALQAYLHHTDGYRPDIGKLMDYARQLRVNIRPFVIALTT
ncbi:MAG: type IV toxin-antitoxin system AbiEi family antitoxin domain-containing protein [Parachlamydiales bacterium]